MMQDCWQELGLQPTGDKRAIKFAYANCIKSFYVDDEPERFQNLREAYETALSEAEFLTDTVARSTVEDYGQSNHANPSRAPAQVEFGDALASQSIEAAASELELAEIDQHLNREEHASGSRNFPDPDSTLIEEIMGEAQVSVAGALALLQRVEREGRFDALDQRQSFQESLASRLIHEEPFPGQLAHLLANHFDWYRRPLRTDLQDFWDPIELLREDLREAGYGPVARNQRTTPSKEAYHTKNKDTKKSTSPNQSESGTGQKKGRLFTFGAGTLILFILLTGFRILQTCHSDNSNNTGSHPNSSHMDIKKTKKDLRKIDKFNSDKETNPGIDNRNPPVRSRSHSAQKQRQPLEPSGPESLERYNDIDQEMEF